VSPTPSFLHLLVLTSTLLRHTSSNTQGGESKLPCYSIATCIHRLWHLLRGPKRRRHPGSLQQ
jgi:hypothetical protein